MISYVEEWEHKRIVEVVKEAMREKGYKTDDSHFRFLYHVPPYDERVKPYGLWKRDVLRYDVLPLLLHLIPGLWGRLKASRPQWLTLFHMPYLVLVDAVIEERGEELIVRPKSQTERNEALRKLLLSHVLDGEARPEVQGILRRKLESEGLVIKGEESSLSLLLDEVFFGETCYPEEMCVRVDSGESTSEDDALEFREMWHVRV